MATRALQVVITGDTRQFGRSLDKAGKDTEHLEGRIKRSTGRAAVAFKGLGLAAGALAAVGIEKSAKAAIEAETSQSKLVTQLKASNISYRAHAKEIDNVIQKVSRLSGLDDEDLQDSFTNIVRVTGNVTSALKLTGLAADFARAKHMDVAKAGVLVGKVAGGNTGILSRYGVAIKPVTTAVDALAKSHGKVTVEQRRAATESDKQATAQAGLALLQQKFSGQAEAYGKTTAGSLDRASVATENLGEIVGAKFTPILAKAATGLVDLVDKAGQLAGPIRTSTGAVRNAYDSVVGAVHRFASRNREELQTAQKAMRNLGKAATYVFETIILPTVRTAVKRIGPILQNLVGVLSGVIRFVTNVLTGKWSKAWDALKDTVRNTVQGIGRILLGGVEIIGGLALRIGKAVVTGIVKGMGSLGHAIFAKVKDGLTWAAKQTASFLDKANPFTLPGRIAKGLGGDGIGKALGGGALPSGGAFGGSLHGARAAMRPFAALGSRYGLQVTSGKDDHSTMTSSGNVSWHSSGEAIDMSGSPQGMHAYARALHDRYGGRLAELISPWAGLDIKNGRPFNFGPAITAQHSGANAHVHVAFDSGRPGIGDGIGQIRNLWTRAGGSKSKADMAAAIAWAESTGNPSAWNRNRDGSIDRGLWQINSVHGSGSTFDRLANAKAAVRISHNGADWSAWSTFKNGAYRKFLGATGLGGRSGGGRLNPSSYVGPRTGTVGPTTGGLGPGMTVASGQSGADFGLAEATARTNDNLGGLIAALTNELRLKQRRAKHIRRYLRRKRVSRANRQKFTEELTQLVGDIAELKATLREYRADARGGATTISAAEGLDAGVAPEGQQLNAAGTALMDAGPTPMDFANASIAEASLTPGLGDDIAATQAALGIATGDLNAARASGDPRRISDAIAVWAGIKASLDSLTEAVTLESDTRQRLIDLLGGVHDELKAIHHEADMLNAIGYREALRFIADGVSGQIVGTNLQGRRQTAGNGRTTITP